MLRNFSFEMRREFDLRRGPADVEHDPPHHAGPEPEELHIFAKKRGVERDAHGPVPQRRVGQGMHDVGVGAGAAAAAK